MVTAPAWVLEAVAPMVIACNPVPTLEYPTVTESLPETRTLAPRKEVRSTVVSEDERLGATQP